jgi:hypothetical protein
MGYHYVRTTSLRGEISFPSRVDGRFFCQKGHRNALSIRDGPLRLQCRGG